MSELFFIKTDQIGKLKIEPNQVIAIENSSKKNFPKISKRHTLYFKEGSEKITYSNRLNFIFGLCLLILFFLKFVFYESFVEGFERNLEILISNICFAFIASYIFYNIVTKNVDKQKKVEAYAVICGILDDIISSGKYVEKIIWDGNHAADVANFKIACERINLSEIQKNETFSKSDYIIFYSSTSINSDIKILFNYMPFLESKILHKINNIQNSSFLRHINLLPVLVNKNLSSFSGDIILFLNMVEELEKTNEKLKIKYLKGYIQKN
ncbi:MAG: hypothetical protein LC112_15990 [Flavobacteriales bacterium]|nr:hypothetical protein [Flavobacteriales bacterium]